VIIYLFDGNWIEEMMGGVQARLGPIDRATE
jgi:hypothetical protein